MRCCLKVFLARALAALLLGGVDLFTSTFLVEGIIGITPVSYIQICTNGFRKGFQTTHRGTTDEDQFQKLILSFRRMQAFCEIQTSTSEIIVLEVTIPIKLTYAQSRLVSFNKGFLSLSVSYMCVH